MAATFGTQLRTQRERKGISLDAIARSTKISATLFEALERNDTSRWPSGIFRRAFMRAYATAIGLDPESTVREFLQHFPDPCDQTHAATDPDRSAAPPAPPPSDTSAFRLTFADDPLFSGKACVDTVRGWPRRTSAAVYDLAVVVVVAAVAFAVAGLFWTPFTVATVCYYFGGVIVLGQTPGAWLIGRDRARPAAREPLALPRAPVTEMSADEPDHVRPFSARQYPRAV